MTSGIYKIENKVNGKVYIGKSINIKNRLRSHKCALSKADNVEGRTNHLLFFAVKKYGITNFTFDILEQLDISDSPLDREYLSQREIFFIDLYDSCNRNKGYNLVRTSPTVFATKEETRLSLSIRNTGDNNPNFGNRWTEEQKQNMSSIKKQQIKDGIYDWMKTEEWRKKLSNNSKKLWEDIDKKKKMADKVAEVNSKLRFYEYDKTTKELKRIWESMSEIIKAYPDYFKIAIYSVCNGYKKSYRGSIWRSEVKCDTL
jgi:group I intron endonuclease